MRKLRVGRVERNRGASRFAHWQLDQGHTVFEDSNLMLVSQAFAEVYAIVGLVLRERGEVAQVHVRLVNDPANRCYAVVLAGVGASARLAMEVESRLLEVSDEGMA